MRGIIRSVTKNLDRAIVQLLERVLSIARRFRGEAPGRDHAGQAIPLRFFVVDDQNSGGSGANHIIHL